MATEVELDQLFIVVKRGQLELGNNNLENYHACFLPIATEILLCLLLSGLSTFLELEHGTNMCI